MSYENGWYKKMIEEPIRPLVKLLRDNGFNTECSCGHVMQIQCQYLPEGEVARLYNLLYSSSKNYKINVTVECIDGKLYSSLEVTITGSTQ